MHQACPLSELAPDGTLRLTVSQIVPVFHTKVGELWAAGPPTHPTFRQA